MSETPEIPTFQMAVSDNSEHSLGEHSEHRKKTERVIYYYAERPPGAPLFIQPLNHNFVPSGDKRKLAEKEFLKRYTPEPLIYYNKVKPSMDRLNDTLDKADKLRAEERYDKAEEEYNAALEIDPSNIRGTFGLGLTYLGAENMDAARKIFDNIMDLDLAFTLEYKHLFNEFGIQLRKKKLHDLSMRYYRQALKHFRDDENLFFNYARALYETEHYEDAFNNLQQAMKIKSDFPEAQTLLELIGEHVEFE